MTVTLTLPELALVASTAAALSIAYVLPRIETVRLWKETK